jgi:hypothetical protein
VNAEQPLDAEAQLDRLYGLPLDEFTRERNALAGRLGKAGDPEGASAVRALARPSLVAWVINQLARRERTHVHDLLAAAEALLQAQETALAGAGTEALQAAQADQRAALRALRASAAGILEAAGRSASEVMLDRVTSALRAAAAEPGARQLLERGRLQAEVEPTGFAPLAGLRLASSAAPAQDELAQRRRRKADARERVRRLTRELRALERRARDAEADADRLEQEAERARERAERAWAEVERVQGELEEAEGQAG